MLAAAVLLVAQGLVAQDDVGVGTELDGAAARAFRGVSRQEYLDPVTLFLTYITDDRLRSEMFTTCLIPTGFCGRYALTNVNSGRYYFAVPVALADSPFFHNQVWLLEPLEATNIKECGHSVPPATTSSQGPDAGALSGDGDFRSPPNSLGTWRLMGKQQLIGCPPIVADGNFVSLLEGQKVYG